MAVSIYKFYLLQTIFRDTINELIKNAIFFFVLEDQAVHSVPTKIPFLNQIISDKNTYLSDQPKNHTVWGEK